MAACETQTIEWRRLNSKLKYLRHIQHQVVILSGVTRVGVTRGGNSGCHPLFFPEITGDLFCSLLSLSLLSLCLVSPPPLDSVTPHLFYLSDLVCPLFFVNSATHFFLRVSPPWRVSPGAVRRPSSP